MAATVVVEPGQDNPLLEAAAQVGQPATDTPGPGEGSTPQTGGVDTSQPKAGSYEAFMSSFGAPGRWAGH